MALTDEEFESMSRLMNISKDTAIERAKAYLTMAETAMANDRKETLPEWTALSSAYSALAHHLPDADPGPG